MSEFDQGSGRKGFVRDVMRRIAPGDEPASDAPEDERERNSARPLHDEVEDLHDSMRLFGPESPEFRRQLDRLLADFETLRRRYQLTRDQSADSERQNERLVNALHEAKQQIELLKEEVDKLCAPPNTYGVFIRGNKEGGGWNNFQARLYIQDAREYFDNDVVSAVAIRISRYQGCLVIGCGQHVVSGRGRVDDSIGARGDDADTGFDFGALGLDLLVIAGYIRLDDAIATVADSRIPG